MSTWLDPFFRRNYQTVQADGVALPQRAAINFIGATAADDPTNNRTNVTITNPSGVVNLRGTYANRPAPGQEGRTYWATDVAMAFFDDGAIWRPHWGIYSGTKPPAVAALTWVNQTALAAATDDKDTLLLTSQSSVADNFHMKVKAVPAANFRFTVGLVTGFGGISNPIAIMGTVLRDAVDGNKFIRFVVYFQTNQLRVNIQRFTNPTTPTTAYFDGPLQPIITGDGGPLWLRCDNGLTAANKITWYYSTNNNEYFQLDQRASTDFLPNGPTQLGVGCDCVGGVANPTIDVTGRYFHWLEETT